MKKLLYAAKLQLITSIYILHGFQLYECQVFVSKKVLKEVQSICRMYLWTNQISSSKKALVVWETLYLPKLVEV